METFLTHAGYGALILFAFVEACSIPISSEITFGFAGVLAYQGHLSLLLVIIIGSLAEMAGSYVSYAIGRLGGRRTVERLGKYVLVTSADIDRAERFFAGRGAWAVTVGRLIPFVRAFTSIAAGMMEVPALQFSLFNLLGTVIWATAFSVTGYAIGHSWASVAHGFSIGGYIIVVLLVIAVIAHRVHAVRKETASKAAAASKTAAAVDATAAEPMATESSAGPAA
jgi:membrane protein DedA with SNARE-associated domain